MTPTLSYALIGFCVLTLAVGQLLFKMASGRLGTLAGALHDPALLLTLGCAVTLYAISTVAWVIALKYVPLSRAYMFMAAGFILVPLGAALFLREPYTIRQFLAGLVVAGGILLGL